MKVYEVEIKQFDRQGRLYAHDTLHVHGGSATAAIRKATRLFLSNGALRSRPAEVVGLQLLAADVR